MVSWYRDGYVGGYGRAVGTGIFPTRAVYSALHYRLASPGTVDLNGVTRLQYYIEFYSLVYGNGRFIYDAADVAANPGRRLSGTSYLAPASAFSDGYTPTPAEIKDEAAQITRGTSATGPPEYLTAAGNIELNFFHNNGQTWDPNEKWWYLIAPTSHLAGGDPSADTPVGDINVNGRSLSLWTNRTPAAPVITVPSGQVTTFAGSTIGMTFSPRDPDRIATFPGDVGPTDFADVAGAQIQFSARPSEADPDPEWTDLPIVNAAGSALGEGWYIEDATAANTGAEQFWRTFSMQIKCGDATDMTPGIGHLPAGNWRIRVRTFDYGHGRPDADDAHPFLDPVPPLTDYTGLYTPDTYPEDNTSPWSESTNIFVTAQVPAPVPLSPKGSTALIEGESVTLMWQYRNTYDPPYAQAERTIQIRRVGETDWTTLVFEDASASPSYLITGYDLVSGNQYEWRVQVTDTSGLTSEFSESAFFWIVPEPGSGGTIPNPGEMIEGATLGCGAHRIEVYRRGGETRVGTISNISSVEWNRVRDDISDSKIVVSGWDIDCGNLLASLKTWAYEIVIFRDNGFRTERVWEGPITLLTYEVDKVTIHAKDVMAYAYRRIIKQAMSDSGNSPTAGATVVNRAMRILLNTLAPDDPNVLAYLQVLAQPDDATQYRSTPAYSRTAFEEIDDMAANAGLDYTAIGRAILLWGTKHRIGTLPEFRDKDLGSPPIVSEYGMSMSNVYAVSDGNGIYGEANRLDEDGKDETYGLVEVLSSTWASDSASESGTYTQAGIETIKASFAAAAERSIGDRYPPPVVVRVPDNTRLHPDVVISIQQLVPGVVVPLRSTGTLRTVVATQKLDAVKVIERGGEETITITLSPFSRDDVEIVEEE